MSERPFHPDIGRRLGLEAEAIETVMHERIGAMCSQISDHIAVWQIPPMPDEWGTSDVSIPRPTNQGEENNE